MKTFRLALTLAILLAASPGSLLADPPNLDPHLEPLRPLLEKTWKGTFKNSKPEKPVTDVARWERVLNGRAVRVTHSINDGVYGGETIIRWDEKKQSLVYDYFTTANFKTEGTMICKYEKYLTHETIVGDAGGITEVRGTSGVQPDGTFHVKVEHLVKGEWVQGHEIDYTEDSAAKVVFK